MVRLSLEAASRCFRVEGRSVRALDNVGFSLRESEIATVLGPSGSGKTTLLRAAAGLERLDSGRAEIARGSRLGFVFQEPRLLSSLTVEGNVALGLGRGCGLGRGKSSLAAREKVGQILSLVGLSDFATAYPRQLSGGMAQRTALARALVRDPDILFLDEPFSALDLPLRERLQDELLGLLSSRGICALFVTHDIGEALYLGDRVLALESGRILHEESLGLGRPRDRHSPQLLGKIDTLKRLLEEVS